MKIILRLYLRDFLKLLILLTFGISLIFSLIGLMGKIDSTMAAKASFKALAIYTLLSMPRYILYILPMAVLICSLFTFAQAFRRHEIAAIKAAGGRLKTLFAPFILTGALLAFTAFSTSEFILP